MRIAPEHVRAWIGLLMAGLNLFEFVEDVDSEAERLR
jgi:hypothetical protein